MLSELGATFVKFGQILSMRPDFVPPAYCNAFLKLVDDVPPFDSAIAMHIFEQEIGRDPRDVFSEFSEKPIAAASFGQVHAATLRNGERVIVKIQRPNLEGLVRADFAILDAVTSLLDWTVNLGRPKIKRLAEEFKKWTKEELDYVKESCYAQLIAQNAADNPKEKIPKTYWEYVTSRVLVQERLEGIWLKDLLQDVRLQAIHAARSTASNPTELHQDIDVSVVAKNLIYNFQHQVFVHGVFHADPHAGNIVVQPDGAIGYVDFGITGRMDADLKQKNLAFLAAMSRGDIDAAYLALLSIFDPPSYLALDQFQADLKQNLEDWLLLQNDQRTLDPAVRYETLRSKSMAGLIAKNLELVRQHGFFLPNIVVRYYRALTIIDVVLLELDPSVNIREEFQVFQQKQMLTEAISCVAVPEAITWAYEVERLIHELPRLLRQVLENNLSLEGTFETRFALLRRVIFAVLRLSRRIALALMFLWVILKSLFALNWFSAERGNPSLTSLLQNVHHRWVGFWIAAVVFLLTSLLLRVLIRYDVPSE